jgi:hypothetical protein
LGGIFTTLVLIAVWPSSVKSQPAGNDPNGIPTRAVTQEELKAHIAFLASDVMNGRTVGSKEFMESAGYAAEQFRKAGLKTVLKDENGKNTYFQPVRFTRKLPDDHARLVIRVGEETRTFDQGKDFKLLFTSPGEFPPETLPVVFAGYGIDEPEYGWNDFEGLDCTGKIAVVLAGAPLRKGKPVLPDSLHSRYLRTNLEKIRALQKRGCRGILTMTSARTSVEWAQRRDLSASAQFVYTDSIMTSGWRNLSILPPGNHLLISRKTARFLFKEYETTPDQIIDRDLCEFSRFLLDRVTIQYRAGAAGESVVSPNVVALVEGKDPVLKNEIIVVGAHLDHVSSHIGVGHLSESDPHDTVFNGANDNASGCTGVLEVAEALAQNPPRRSVAFVLFTGEEIGMIGSFHFVNHGPFPIEAIKAHINLDMIGRSSLENGPSRAQIVGGWEGNDSKFRAILSEANARTSKWPLVFGDNIPSDHLSFTDRGIPSVFFFSGTHDGLHTPKDEADRLDFEKMQKVTELVIELTTDLGNREKFW